MGWSTVLFSLVVLFWGEVFSLFSATTGDVFASKNASANYGVVYSDEGVSFLLCRIRRGSSGRVFRRFVRGALLQCGRTLRRRGTAFVVCVAAVGTEQDCEGSSRYLGKPGCSGEGGDKERERKREKESWRTCSGRRVSVEEPAMRDGGGKLTSAELLEKPAEVEEAACEVSTGLPVSDAAEARVPLTRQTVSALRLRACASKYSCARPSKATRSFWAGPLISVSAK